MQSGIQKVKMIFVVFLYIDNDFRIIPFFFSLIFTL